MKRPVITFSRRLRQSPYHVRVMEAGVTAFTVYNHMLLPTAYRSSEEDYWHLREHVQLWDVAAERQVEIQGPDALRLVEYMTPRDVSRCRIGQCVYAPLVDEQGGMVNDPLILRLAEDRFWVSLADSDVLLWAKGLASGLGLDVGVHEPDVSPLAVQGPKADDVAAAVLGGWVRDLRFFRFRETDVEGIPVVVARSGWGTQGGFEVYLRDGSRGAELWDLFYEAGRPCNIRTSRPNLIDRIEGRLLSYGTDMTLADNPVECGLARFCDFDKPAAYLARAALDRIRREGVTRSLVHLLIDGEPIEPPTSTYPVSRAGGPVGYVTSGIYSPRLERNIALAMVHIDAAHLGTKLDVDTGAGAPRSASVTDNSWQA